MATYTTNLNLEKPATSENFDLLKINANWDKIDAGYGTLDSKIDTKIRTKDTVNPTIDLNSLDNGITTYSSSSQNIPVSATGGTILTMRNNYNSQGVQIAQANGYAGFYYRNLINSSWGSWVRVQ